jgi:hypothetical protein
MPINPDNLPLPLPETWVNIHRQLEAQRLKIITVSVKVPVPLILNGAAFSKASAIRERWRETLDWAERYGCLDELLKEYVAPPPGRDIADELAGVSDDGKGWWPDMTYWNREPQSKHTMDEFEAALDRLRAAWGEVAGDVIAGATRPGSITGSKRRRLLVIVTQPITPPWGTWESATHNPVAFRQLRHAVNAVIAPLEVDHIDFELHEG